MASNSELYLMTQLLNLEGVKVIDYRIIEGNKSLPLFMKFAG